MSGHVSDRLSCSHGLHGQQACEQRHTVQSSVESAGTTVQGSVHSVGMHHYRAVYTVWACITTGQCTQCGHASLQGSVHSVGMQHYRVVYNVGIQIQTWLTSNCFGKVVSVHEGIYQDKQLRLGDTLYIHT